MAGEDGKYVLDGACWETVLTKTPPVTREHDFACFAQLLKQVAFGLSAGADDLVTRVEQRKIRTVEEALEHAWLRPGARVEPLPQAHVARLARLWSVALKHDDVDI